MKWLEHVYRNFIRTQAKVVLGTQLIPIETRGPDTSDYQTPFQLRSLWSDTKERHMNFNESERDLAFEGHHRIKSRLRICFVWRTIGSTLTERRNRSDFDSIMFWTRDESCELIQLTFGCTQLAVEVEAEAIKQKRTVMIYLLCIPFCMWFFMRWLQCSG